MDGEYREPSWRGVILTLVAVIVVIAGLVLLASFLLQENCLPVASQVTARSRPSTRLREPGSRQESADLARRSGGGPPRSWGRWARSRG